MNQAQPSVNPFTLDFIKKLEGYTPKPKWDYKQYSTGYGTRWNPGDPVGTKADHEAALAREAGKVGSWLDQNVTTQLQPNQRAALTSAGFNLGTGEKGLGRLLGDINAGNWDSVARRLPTFNKAGGEVNKGLINRRAAEVEMLTGRKPSGYIGGTAAAPAQTVPAQMPQEALTPPSGRYSKLADMLLASGAGAKPRGWGELLNAGGDLALGYTLGDKADTQQKEYQSKLGQMLSGSDASTMPDTLIQSGDPALMQAGVQAKMQQAQAQAKANAPLRGKERFMSTPNGVMDVETMQIVPGTEKNAAQQPKLAPNYRWAEDGKTAEPIPGTKPWQEQQEAGRKESLRREQQQGAARTVVEDVDRALNVLDTAFTSAPTRWMGSFISGTPAAELQAHIDSVGSNVGIDQLQKMRDSSPTGGALGQVPFQQQKRLEQLLGSIDISQPQHVLQDNLKRIGNLYLEILHGSEEELVQKYGEQEGRERHAKIPFYDVGFRNRLPDRTPTFGRETEGAPPAGGDQPPPQSGPPPAAPPQAVDMLRSDPSPEAIQEFDEIFGPGAAQRVLQMQPAPQPQPIDFGISP